MRFGEVERQQPGREEFDAADPFANLFDEDDGSGERAAADSADPLVTWPIQPMQPMMGRAQNISSLRALEVGMASGICM